MKKYIITLIVNILGFCSYSQTMTTPASISPGAKIAIITPASAADSMTVVKAIEIIKARGYDVVTYPSTFGKRYGTFPANDSARIADLEAAFSDPQIQAIMCARGGYGTTRLLPQIDMLKIVNNPKWFIGYSDISAVHAMLNHIGLKSIHGPMTGHIVEHSKEPCDTSLEMLFSILEKGLPYSFEIPAHPYNKTGCAEGKFLGGNFIVVNNLAETPYDIMNIGDHEDVILFVEEVGEKLYAVERMLLRLHQSGALGNLKGIVFGQFTDYKPNNDFHTMEDMIQHWLKEWGYYDREDFTIVYGLPSGHGSPNYPVVCGATLHLQSTPDGVAFTFD